MELSDVEAKVLVLIKEYLNNNRVFNAKEIVPFVMNGIKSSDLENPPNESGIQKIIWKFIKERIVVQGSKLSKYTILENGTRKGIFNHVNKYPGSHLREIMDKLSLGSHVAMWHTNLLIKFGLVRSSKIGKYKAFFNNSLEASLDTEIFHLGNRNINEIIQILFTSSDGLTINQMSTQLGMHYNTTTNYLHTLNQMQLLYQNEDNNQTLYLLNRERFKELLDGIESIKAEAANV